MPRAHLAFEPCRVSADGWWQAVGQRQPLALVDCLDSVFPIQFQALGVDSVVVLANGNIQGAFQLSAVHIHLTLCKVHGLTLCHAILLKVVERLEAMGLELQNVFSFRRTRYALADTVQAAAHMAAEVNPALGAIHAHANGSQITDDGGLLVLTTAKKPQDSALKLLHHCPTE